MDSGFIETLGEGEYQEKIESYILEVKLEVRASDEDTAMKELFKLKDETVIKLKDSGLSTHEIIDGGYELWKPWYGQKKSGKYAHYKILIETKNENTLSKSVESIGDLFQNQRHTLTYEMKQPKYENSKTDEHLAIKKAYEDAINKAYAIADISNIGIGKLIQANELSKSKRNSGAYGDEDWMGDDSRFAGGAVVAGGGFAEDDNLETKKAERTIWLRYKFKFQIITKNDMD